MSTFQTAGAGTRRHILHTLLVIRTAFTLSLSPPHQIGGWVRRTLNGPPGPSYVIAEPPHRRPLQVPDHAQIPAPGSPRAGRRPSVQPDSLAAGHGGRSIGRQRRRSRRSRPCGPSMPVPHHLDAGPAQCTRLSAAARDDGGHAARLRVAEAVHGPRRPSQHVRICRQTICEIALQHICAITSVGFPRTHFASKSRDAAY